MTKSLCAMISFAILFVATPVLAKPPAKAAKATKVATQNIPVYDVKAIRESCMKMGNVAHWDAKSSRCLMRPVPEVSKTTWVAVGVLVGAATVGATIALVAAIRSATTPTTVRYETADGAKLW